MHSRAGKHTTYNAVTLLFSGLTLIVLVTTLAIAGGVLTLPRHGAQVEPLPTVFVPPAVAQSAAIPAQGAASAVGALTVAEVPAAEAESPAVEAVAAQPAEVESAEAIAFPPQSVPVIPAVQAVPPVQSTPDIAVPESAPEAGAVASAPLPAGPVVLQAQQPVEQLTLSPEQMEALTPPADPVPVPAVEPAGALSAPAPAPEAAQAALRPAGGDPLPALGGPQPSPLRVMVPTDDTWRAIKAQGYESLLDYFPNLDPVRSFAPGPRMVLPFDRSLGEPDLDAFPANPFRTLAILVQFTDNPATAPATFFDTLLFGTGPQTVRGYYAEASYGLLDIVGVQIEKPSALGWRTAPQSYAYYVNGQNCTGSYPNNCQKLTEDLVAQVNPLVNFAQYDNNGDGYVDTVFIIHAGSGAEATGSPDMIWSHSWWTRTEPLVDGVRVGSYTTEPEFWFNVSASTSDMTHGVYVHELGHAFGLPDLYDVDYSSAGVGDWSLMGGGSWNGSLGNSPAHPDAWSREFLQFNPVTNITGQSGTFTALNVQANPNNAIYRINSGQPNEYWLIENRQKTGSDAALPGAGLLIWHVDGNLGGSNRYECKQVNNYLCSSQHFRVALEQADGLLQMENNVNEGNGGDPFPGTSNNTAFNFTTNPNATSYFTSANTNVRISQISASASNMTFRYVGVPTLIAPSNGSSTTNRRPNFTWSTGPSPVSYQIQIDNNSDFSSPEVDATLGAATFTPGTNLANQTTHYWRVCTYDGTDWGAWSATWSVTVNSIPAAPTLVAPPNNSTTLDRTPFFDWNSVTGAADYQIQIDNNNDFSSPEVFQITAATDFTPGADLADGTWHFWRVRARNSDAEAGAWSTTWQVMVNTQVDVWAPAAPRLISPAHLATTADTTPAYTWNTASGAVMYQIQVAEEVDFSTIIFDRTLTTTTVTDTTVRPFREYWWRVRARNALGNWGPWSLPRQYTLTLLSSPANAAHLTNLKPTFTWAALSGATQYRLQVADDPGFGSLLIDQPRTSAQLSYTPAVALPTGQHYWRLIAFVGVEERITPARIFTLTPPVPLAPALLLPASGQIFTVPTPDFSWNAAPNALYHQIQIDNTYEFTSPVQDVTLAPGVLTYTAAPLPNGGTYYWRVRGINDLGVAGAWSGRRSFKLSAGFGGPTLISPASGAAMTNTTPTLVWNPVAGSASYQVQIALATNFVNLVETGTPLATSFTAAPLADGRYYWRARGVSGTGVPGAWSSARSFVIDTTGPAAPTVLTPVNGKGTTDTTPYFDWSAPSTATLYQFELDNDPDFSSVVISVPRTISEYTLPSAYALTYGTYYWRVAARDVLGNTGPWSLTGQFAITIHKTPLDGASTTTNPPVFTWAAVTGATSYEFELARDPGFGDKVADPDPFLGTTFTAPPLAPETYYWRVRVNGGPWMPTWAVTVTGTPPTKPVLSAPATGALITDNTPTLSWGPVIGAADYEVQIDNSDTFKSPEQIMTATDALVIPAPLPDGKWYWRVRARNSVGAPGTWSVKWYFTIDTVPPLAPVLITPLDGASSTNTKLAMKWYAVKGAASYELELYLAGAPLPPFALGNVTSYKPLTPLDYGQYLWRVRALDKAGNPSAWSEQRSFTIVAGITAPPGEITPVPTEQPTEPPTDRPVQRIEAESELVLRDGLWTLVESDQASGGQYLMSSGQPEDPAALSLPFGGEWLELTYVQHPALGTFLIEIDGAPLQIVDSSVAVASDQLFAATLRLTLDPGLHLLRIVPLTGVVALDVFVVEPQVTPPPAWPTPEVPPTIEPPTVEPTAEPTVEPTIAPTVEPTVEPTAEPTIEPTAEPITATPVPESPAESGGEA